MRLSLPRIFAGLLLGSLVLGGSGIIAQEPESVIDTSEEIAVPAESTPPVIPSDPVAPTDPAETVGLEGAAGPGETSAPEGTVNPAETIAPVETAIMEETVTPEESADPVVPAKPASIAGRHQGKVNALIYDGKDRILSAGEDGFLGIWNIEDNAAEERFQLSGYALTSMVLRPGYPQIAVAESNGMGLYRISAWDYQKKKNLFILRFRDPISCLAYSAGGNFIILSAGSFAGSSAGSFAGTSAGSFVKTSFDRNSLDAQNGVVFINPETGELLPSPENLTGPVSFTATGKSERTMISYSPSGSLSYWELSSGDEIRHFPVPAGITSPILFGNNRFFGGFDSQGLVILDAVSGKEIFRDGRIKRGTLFPANTDKAEFFCLSPAGGNTELAGYTIDNRGRSETRNRRLIPNDIPFVTTAAETSSGAALGSSDGRVYLLSPDGSSRPMEAVEQIPVREAAASGSVLAFILDGDLTGFLPLDYTAIRDGSPVHLTGAESYTRIAADPEGNLRASRPTEVPGNSTGAKAGTSGSPEIFLYWQNHDLKNIPVIKIVEPDTSQSSFRESGRIGLDKFSMPSPIRSASVLGKQALFLDSVGNIAVFSLGPTGSKEPPDSRKPGTREFSFSSAGALDAAFLDGQNIIIGRSAVLGNTPFLKINITTGETVPLAYPASIGVRIYRSGSGSLYCAAVEGSGSAMQTALLRLDPSNPARSVKMAEYQGEDTAFGIAESAGVIAATIGGDGALLYGGQSFIPFERSPGLPVALVNGGNRFIAIDTEGNISWHDAGTGELLALLRIYKSEWILKTKDGTALRGPVE
ncbi:hypothetical protein AGMMS50230_21570 [Spirochaetia bacterium]|nr:hypothetical protein AGMMS50230_21570 [Spirochaetia bacterium]